MVIKTGGRGECRHSKRKHTEAQTLLDNYRVFVSLDILYFPYIQGWRMEGQGQVVRNLIFIHKPFQHS